MIRTIGWCEPLVGTSQPGMSACRHVRRRRSSGETGEKLVFRKVRGYVQSIEAGELAVFPWQFQVGIQHGGAEGKVGEVPRRC